VLRALVTRYRRHAAWLQDGALLRDIARLAGGPAMTAALVAATDRFAASRR
jgi:hypothetical protein